MINRSIGAAIQSTDTDTRTVTVRLLEWNEPRDVTDADRVQYREQWSPGSLTLPDDVHVKDEHGGEIIGRAIPASYNDDGTGPTLDLVLANTSRGLDTLALIDAGVIRAVSIEAQPIEPPATFKPAAGELVTRTAAVVHGVAFAFRPALSAPVLAVRELSPEHVESENMTEHDNAPADNPADLAVTAGELSRSLDELRDDMERAIVARSNDNDTAGVHPASEFRSIGDYALAAFDNPEIVRALADQITTNNPGVVPPAWLNEIAGIITQGRPLIESIGSAPLPSTGMQVNYPYYDGDLSSLIGEQSAEKTEITSARVDIKSGNAPVKTYAGGSDVSYQLIRRSGPDYTTAYLRILMNAYAVVTDAAASTALETVAVASGATFDPATGDLAGLAAALFTASDEVDTATGVPATCALAAPDVFLTIGGLSVAASSVYGVQNVAGTGAASTLSVNVSGLPVIKCKGLTAGSLIVTNREASTWYDDGPMTVSAPDVAKLGENMAGWGMGTYTAPIPNGIRSIGAGGATRSRKV